MNRRHRLLAAALAALALLFAQFAVAAHACRAVGEVTPASVSAAHGCCNEGESVAPQANLCLAHCQYGETSFDGGHAVAFAPPPDGPALRVGPAWAAAGEAETPAARRPLPAPEPPVAIRFGVRRI